MHLQKRLTFGVRFFCGYIPSVLISTYLETDYYNSYFEKFQLLSFSPFTMKALFEILASGVSL